MAVVSRVSAKLGGIQKKLYHKKWCRNFLLEQAKTTKFVQKLVEKPVTFDFSAMTKKELSAC